MTNFIYHQSFENFSKNLQTLKVSEWIMKKSQVLEFGCHTGLLSKYLQENNDSNIVGIDLNDAALQKAQAYQDRSIRVDIENTSDWQNHFEEGFFDAISFLHILEHLRNPQKVLQQAIKFMKPNGVLIIGLPNVSNAKDRFDMFFGKFNYTDIGVMDKTHVHMFNYKTATKFIEDVGLEIEEYFSPWQVNPVKHFLDHLPVLHRIAKKMKNKPSKIFGFSPNITDSIMLFKCRLKVNENPNSKDFK